MPRLLDNRVVGGSSDVINRVIPGTPPGYVMQVAPDGINLELSSPTNQAGNNALNNVGISVMSNLCENWVDISPTSFTQIYGLAYGNGIFVAVGEHTGVPVINYGTVLPTGTTWSNVTTLGFTGGQVYSVAYGNDFFVAVGANGQIGYSNDGKNWYLISSSPTVGTENLYSVAYSPSIGWIAVGTLTSDPTSAGVTFSSSDGISWTKITPALDNLTYANVPIYGISWGNGQWIAVGGKTGYPTNHIATSNDGINWTIQATPNPLAAHLSVVYGNGKWVVGTSDTSPTTYNKRVISSLDGITWYQVNYITSFTLSDTNTVAYGNGLFLAGSNNLLTSADGYNFDPIFNLATDSWSSGATCSCYGNGLFLVGGGGGKIVRSNTLTEYISSSVIPSVSSGQLHTVVFGSSGSWTCPTGVTQVYAVVVGGAGGSYYGGACSCVEISGENGGVAIGQYTVIPGSTYSITVGTGGIGASATPGGTSSFGSFCSATGGNPGVAPGMGYGGTLRNKSAPSGTILDGIAATGLGNSPVVWNLSAKYGAGMGDSGTVEGTGGIGGAVMLQWVG